jgi:hypothetical protein
MMALVRFARGLLEWEAASGLETVLDLGIALDLEMALGLEIALGLEDASGLEDVLGFGTGQGAFT